MRILCLISLSKIIYGVKPKLKYNLGPLDLPFYQNQANNQYKQLLKS